MISDFSLYTASFQSHVVAIWKEDCCFLYYKNLRKERKWEMIKSKILKPGQTKVSKKFLSDLYVFMDNPSKTSTK